MYSFCGKKWARAPEISDLAELQKIILQNRKLDSHEKIEKFLSPSFADLHDPFLMRGAKIAVEKILEKIRKKERILIFGDFDVDGISATTILVAALREIGAKISFRIPDRNKNSHGLKKFLIDEIATKNVKLIVTVDCGINDCAEISHAKNLGIETIVTDHHESKKNFFPHDAIAVLNPKQKNCNYPEKNLSGAAIAFKLISAIAEKFFEKNPEKIALFLEKFLEIAALGIVADCVEMTGENRILAKFGIEKLKFTKWDGIQKIFEKTGTEIENINEETIGFLLAPRLNAASRIDDVYVAANLFLGDESQNFARVEKLENLNEIRRELTENAVKKSLPQLQKNSPLNFFFDENWSPGILGLLAGRFAEKTEKPTIAATIRDDGKLAASCRAPGNFSIIEALQNCAEFLENFGGHRGAAGFLTDPKNKKKIHENLENFFKKNPQKKIPQPIDAFVSPEILNFELADFLNFLRPFGDQNPAPIFGLKSATVVDFAPLGKNKNHAKIWLEKNGQNLEFILFFGETILQKIAHEQRVDAIFSVSQNFFRGKKKLQFLLRDLREI